MRTRSTFQRNSPVAVLVIAAVTSSFVRAQDAEAPKVDTEVPKASEATQAVEPTDVRDGSTRSPAAAVWMSVGSTVVPAALGGGLLAVPSTAAHAIGWTFFGAGLLFGPSVGQVYSGRLGKAALFILGRAASGAIIAGGVVMLIAYGVSDTGIKDGPPAGAIAMITIGGVFTTALAVWETVDSYSSAKKYNEEHAIKSISLSPFVMPSTGRNRENGMAYGLALAGKF